MVSYPFRVYNIKAPQFVQCVYLFHSWMSVKFVIVLNTHRTKPYVDIFVDSSRCGNDLVSSLLLPLHIIYLGLFMIICVVQAGIFVDGPDQIDREWWYLPTPQRILNLVTIYMYQLILSSAWIFSVNQYLMICWHRSHLFNLLLACILQALAVSFTFLFPFMWAKISVQSLMIPALFINENQSQAQCIFA